ncbi:hypothetical protein J2853_002838 [Streptosporangium lutulentum]|uniref:Uncharacterized protein n=1 Tax=Streptosporangium lutulentum TaxID=1461250 RepID=A0ABT9QA48_9ACTN|nr:hypothetical protein [Streptosporangium lutulentum]
MLAGGRELGLQPGVVRLERYHLLRREFRLAVRSSS